MTDSKYLADTSALVRLLDRRGSDLSWDREIARGFVSICSSTEIELLYSARSTAHRKQLVDEIRQVYVWVDTPDGVWLRAEAVQDILTRKGLHRSAGLADLLVAATAELNGLDLLHYDADFEAVAKVTGQRHTWLAPRGSLD